MSTAPERPAPAGPARRPPPENLWLNLLFNAVIPAVLLSVASKEKYLGPVWGMVTALLFPLGYGLYDLARRRTWNLLSVLGFVSTLLTGGLGLLKIGGFWFAVKEAAVPMLLGLAIPLSLRTRQPLVRTLLYNDQVMNTARIAEALARHGRGPEFAALLAWASWVLAGSFLFSGLANFALAWWLLPAESGTELFNHQLGKLQFWSWPITVLPGGAIVFYALMRLVKGLEQLTGLTGNELFHPAPNAKAADSSPPMPR